MISEQSTQARLPKQVQNLSGACGEKHGALMEENLRKLPRCQTECRRPTWKCQSIIKEHTLTLAMGQESLTHYPQHRYRVPVASSFQGAGRRVGEANGDSPVGSCPWRRTSVSPSHDFCSVSLAEPSHTAGLNPG